MLRCDFSSVIGIIREYISEGNSTSQPDFISDLFRTFLEKNEDFDFDNGPMEDWWGILKSEMYYLSPFVASLLSAKGACQLPPTRSSLHKLHRLLLGISEIFFVFCAVYLTGGGSLSATLFCFLIKMSVFRTFL